MYLSTNLQKCLLEGVLSSDSFEEYRQMQYRMNGTVHTASGLDDGTICPACPVSIECSWCIFIKKPE